MPVDLSRIGLVGQEAYDNSQLSKAQTDFARMNTLAKGVELQDAEHEKELDAIAAQTFSSVLRGSASGGGEEGSESDVESRADALTKTAETLFAGGAPKRGLDMLKAADEMRAAESKLESEKVTREQNRLESQLKTSDLIYRYIGTAKNQSELDNGKEYLLNSPAVSEEDKAHIRTMPDVWSPEYAQFWRDKAISAKEAATLQLTERARDQQDTNLANTQAYRASMLAQQKARLEEVKRYHDIQAKGGKSATAPNEQEVKNVATMIRSQIPGMEKVKLTYGANAGETPDEVALQAGAIAIASAAKDMIKSNPSLTWGQAVTRAIVQSKANGDWKTIRNYKDYGLFETEEGTETNFKPIGKSKEFPAPLPPKGTALTKGRYYMTVRGRAKWNGSSFEPAE
jgi:hypothetical protein